MNATFYTFNKRENSTKRPTGDGQTYSITLKDECGLVVPYITLNIGATVNPTGYNYCFIAEFGRYYFVSDWSWERGLWTASLIIDALATWKDSIGSATEYIARSSASYDGDIVDNLYPLTGEIVTQNTAIDNIWNRASYNPYLPNAGFYVVGVIGDDQVTYWMMTQPVFAMFMNGLYSDAYVTSIQQRLTAVTQSVDAILTAVNPLQYINSIRWYPFHYSGEIDPSYYKNDVPVGWGSVHVANAAYQLPVTYLEIVKNVTLPSHPQASSRGRYMNKGQFTNRTLFYPPFGVIGLDPDKIAYADSVKLTFRIDFHSGNCYLTVSAVKDGVGVSVLAYVSAQGSSDCLRAGITSNRLSTFEETERQLAIGSSAGHALAGAVNEMGSVTSVSGAIAGGVDLGATVAGVTSDIMSYQGERSRASYPVLSVTGSDGAIAAFIGNPVISSVFQIAVDDDNDQRGRPLCVKGQIGNYAGYLVISDPDISLPSTQAEQQIVKQYLANGFFYE